MSIAAYLHNDYKAEFPTYKDEIEWHYSYLEVDFETRYRLARIPSKYIESSIDSDVDEYGMR